MKKKLGLVALVGCLSLSIAGCKADMDDLNKQLEKMSNVIEKGDIFEDDYQIKGTIKYVVDGKTSSIGYHLERDDENYWVKTEVNDDGKESYIESWIGEKNDKYYAFYDENNEDKMYAEIDSKDVDSYLSDSMGDYDEAELDLNEIYEASKMALESMVNFCNDTNQNTGSCEIEKTLFGTVTVTLTSEIGNQKSVTSYSLRGGKIRKASTKITFGETTMEMEMKFSYGNQVVRLPDTDDFEKVEG